MAGQKPMCSAWAARKQMCLVLAAQMQMSMRLAQADRTLTVHSEPAVQMQTLAEQVDRRPTCPEQAVRTQRRGGMVVRKQTDRRPTGQMQTSWSHPTQTPVSQMPSVAPPCCSERRRRTAVQMLKCSRVSHQKQMLRNQKQSC